MLQQAGEVNIPLQTSLPSLTVIMASGRVSVASVSPVCLQDGLRRPA